MTNMSAVLSASKHYKAKPVLFNFPMNAATSSCLEQLASMWEVSLAAAIRRSIGAAHDIAIANDPTLSQQMPRQDTTIMSAAPLTTVLTALLTINNELLVTKNNTANILAVMPLVEKNSNSIDQLGNVATTSLQPLHL